MREDDSNEINSGVVEGPKVVDTFSALGSRVGPVPKEMLALYGRISV